MAKAKRKTVLTTDVEEILVIPGRQPYPVPKNWCWTKLGMVCSLDNGKKISNESLTYFDARTLRTNTGKTRDGGILVGKGQKVILVDGENSGEVFVIPYRGYMGSTFRLLNIVDGLNETYIRYFIDSNRNLLRDNKIGSAIPHLNKDVFYGLNLPVPPLSEQNRIVDRIESLFAKLDEAKELVQYALESFVTRKFSILHKAFTGELTVKWRKENNIDNCSWENKSIEELCHSLNYGTSKKSKPDGSVVVIRMGNIQQGEIDWNDLAYTEDREDVEKYKLYPGDVLFNRTNSAALVGKTAIYRGDYPAIYAGYLIKLDYDHNLVLGDYLNYALNTTTAKEYCNRVKTDGVNQSNINAKKIGAFVIPVASIPEQYEIIRIVNSLLEKEKQAEQTAEMVKDQIDEMKKTILTQAFRGKLGTNDTSDKNAKELLKEILIGETNANKKNICKKI